MNLNEHELDVADNVRLAKLNQYLSKGIHDVHGWCIPQLWQVIWPLRSAIGDGGIAEIGVFEGKYLIGLAETFGSNSERKAIAIDVFDMQQFNLDKAGVGKRDVLLRNMKKFGFRVRTH
jgi:hypothetical protein